MNSRFAIGAIFVLALTAGCGPSSDMGYVSGVVTLDGEPVGNASVTFYQVGARPSVGTTDNVDGSYELVYTREKMGALIGEHKVTIFQEEADRPVFFKGQEAPADTGPEFKVVKIPRKYSDREKTDLTATVVNGSNEFNFDLKTK